MPDTDVPMPEPDPGNSPPEAWTDDLDPDATDHVYGLINDVAVTLPEPGAL